MQASVMFARFPYGACDHPDVTDWFSETVQIAKADPRISQVVKWRIDDTPITMGRNRCLRTAQTAGVDLLVKIDSDMSPDLDLPDAKPFWQSSFDFWWEHHRNSPCIIGAPYCGPPPDECVYVFRWTNRRSSNPNPDWKLEMFARTEAAIRSGMEEVAALPTGLMLIDMRVLEKLTLPWFAYEWADAYADRKASTEDVYFSRNVSSAGYPIYCNWDAWAGHWKKICVGKPQFLAIEEVHERYYEAAKRGISKHDRMIQVGVGKGRNREAPGPAFGQNRESPGPVFGPPRQGSLTNSVFVDKEFSQSLVG